MLIPILTLVPSAARSAAGNGDWLDLLALAAASRYEPPLGPRILRVQIEVTAISGATATLTVFIEDSIDGATTAANSVGASSAITTVSRQVITIGPRGDAYPANFAWPFNASRCRARWTLTGTTPNCTFSVKGVLI